METETEIWIQNAESHKKSDLCILHKVIKCFFREKMSEYIYRIPNFCEQIMDEIIMIFEDLIQNSTHLIS